MRQRIGSYAGSSESETRVRLKPWRADRRAGEGDHAAWAGVGPLTALAYVLIIGTPTPFQRGKQIGTYDVPLSASPIACLSVSKA